MAEPMEVAAAAPLLPDEDLEFETSKGVKPINSFDSMKLKQGLIKGIYTFGFEKPSAIQQRAIVPIVSGQSPYIRGTSVARQAQISQVTTLKILKTG